MLDSFVDGRSGVGGADHPALGFAPKRDSTPPEIALAYASVFKTPQKVLPPVYEPRWTAWGSATAPTAISPSSAATTYPHARWASPAASTIG
jgi:hypothetical protein